MGSIVTVTVLILIAETHARHPAANDKLPMNNAVDKMVGTLVEKLLARDIQVSPLQHQALDKTTLHKQSASGSPVASHHGSAAPWNLGLARQEVVKAAAPLPPAATAAAATSQAALPPTAAAAVSQAARGQGASSALRISSGCGLQCDFSRRSAFAETMARAYQKFYWPKNTMSTSPKTSCEFKGVCPNYPFEPSAVGTYSYRGMKGSSRSTNQDRGSVVYPFAGNPQSAFFAVYDGHGVGGEIASDFAMNAVQDTLEEHLGLLGHRNVAAALQTAFMYADRQLLAMEEALTHSEAGKVKRKNRGTTALAALMRGNQVWVANAGDSRCVLASKNGQGSAMRIKVKDLSTDQKPNSPGERERIEQSGGYVSDPPAPGFPGRVYPMDAVDGEWPGLTVSRSIGDYALKESGVIATPEVEAHTLGSDDLFMIMASDGVWEFISSQEAADIVWAVLQSGGDASKATDVLVENAKLRWLKEEKYHDDITAIIVTLPLLAPASVRNF